MKKSTYPFIATHNEKVVFHSGSLVSLPNEYNKKATMEVLNKFYSDILAKNYEHMHFGTDPIGFDYISQGDFCNVGLIFLSKEKGIHKNLKKKHKENVLDLLQRCRFAL